MRIAHVVSTFPPHLGGMGQVAQEECKELAKRGHEVTVFSLSYPGVKYQDGNFPFKAIRLKSWLKLGDAGWVPQLLGRLKGFDLVHLHYPWYGGAEWVWLAKKFNKQKYVVTYHMDAEPQGNFKRLVRKVYDAMFAKAIFKNATRIFIVDKEYFITSRLCAAVDLEKVCELPNPVNLKVFKPVVAERKKKYLLFVGNLFLGKRLDLLLKVMPKISSDISLVVVGGGYEEKRYQQMAAGLKLTDRVNFVGRISKANELAAWYAGAEMLCVPSEKESFSLATAEALASGCPVVGSDIPGLRNQALLGGVVFSVGSSEAFLFAINRVLAWTAEERTKQMSFARQEAEKRFSLPSHINKLGSVYQEIIG